MEIVLTVIGVLVFFRGSYFMGNWLVGFKDDTAQDKMMKSFLGMLVMLVVLILVGFVSSCIYMGVLVLIN